MATEARSPAAPPAGIAKCPTGIRGLDQITDGGLPAGRPTLVCGGPGCGKTLLAAEFLVRGIVQYGEPGVFMAFEETADDLTKNVASLGFDLDALVAEGKLAMDHVRVERSEIEETGEYDLEGLFVRLNYAIDTVGAKRVVLDTIESLFAGLSNTAILRAELRRLFRWLKDKGVTAIITGERGDDTLTRQGLEEYVSDCVIMLDHRVAGQMSTRRLRVVKYRGSTHGTNEYPFLIDEAGISVMPITAVGLDHPAGNERISSGVARLDTMLGGEGYYRGSSILVSGTAGTGKSTLAAHFAAATCKRGERCQYFAFEESPAQIVRNMHSVGIDLAPWVERGTLRIAASRPSLFGLEMHLATMHRAIEEFDPAVVVIDPVSNFVAVGSDEEVRAMLTRLVDNLKSRGTTSLFTHLSHAVGRDHQLEGTDFGISSVMDAWLLLRDIELGGERNRGLYVLKARGMAHSNQIREFVLTQHGVDLLDVYVGPEGVLTGSARIAQEGRERASEAARIRDAERARQASERKRTVLAAQIAALQAELAAEESDIQRAAVQETQRKQQLVDDREKMAHARKADSAANDGD